MGARMTVCSVATLFELVMVCTRMPNADMEIEAEMIGGCETGETTR